MSNASVPLFPPRIIETPTELNADTLTAALPLSRFLTKIADAANYLTGKGYAIVPACGDLETELSNHTYHFGIIPRSIEVSSSKLYHINRIHFFKLIGDDDVEGTITIDSGEDYENTKTFLLARGQGWEGWVPQHLTEADVATEITVNVATTSGHVHLMSYSCFELPRWCIDPTATGRGIDRDSLGFGAPIYYGNAQQSFNNILSTDPLKASRRVLFVWAAPVAES